MKWLRYFRRKRHDDELSTEIEAYLLQEIDDNLAAGLDHREAVFPAAVHPAPLSAIDFGSASSAGTLAQSEKSSRSMGTRLRSSA
jgi:hypothetical protein